MNQLAACRSPLYLPASNSRAIDKARSLGPDMVILDLEDAVKPADKDIARLAAVEAAGQGFGASLVAIRINATGQWHDADLAAVKGSAAHFVILPRVESKNEVEQVVKATAKPVLAMIETAVGVLAAADIAPATAGLVTGTNDLAASLGLPRGCGRAPLQTALQMIVLAARAASVAAFDGVYNRLEDQSGFEAECEEGRLFGFDGKTLIHPSQIEPANRIFSPNAEEIDSARRLIASATGGAERFEGEMIERMHVEQARAVLAKARVDGN